MVNGGRVELTRAILVGVIGAPHGIRGEVRLKSFTARPTAIGDYGTLRAEDNATAVHLRAVRALKDDMVVARIEGVTTREAAAALTGTRLMMDRAVLPAADEEEFYHADLIGLEARAEDGTLLGVVSAVVGFGGGDILDIRKPEGDSLMVAFTKAFVPVVDVPAHHLVVAAGALVGDDEDGAGDFDETGGTPRRANDGAA